MDVCKTLLWGVYTALVAYPGLAVIEGLVPQVLLADGVPGPVGNKALNGLAAGMDAYAVTPYVLRQVTAQAGIDGVNKFLTEKLITEILVQVDVQTAAALADVGTLNLKRLEVKITLILLKVIPHSGAYGSIVRLSLNGNGGHNDGQCRHKGPHKPGHTVKGLLFKLGQLVNDSCYLLLEIFDKSAIVYLGVTRLSVADTGNELIVNAEQVNNQLLGGSLVGAGNKLLIYKTLGENVTYNVTDVSLKISTTCHSSKF